MRGILKKIIPVYLSHFSHHQKKPTRTRAPVVVHESMTEISGAMNAAAKKHKPVKTEDRPVRPVSCS